MGENSELTYWNRRGERNCNGKIYSRGEKKSFYMFSPPPENYADYSKAMPHLVLVRENLASTKITLAGPP